MALENKLIYSTNFSIPVDKKFFDAMVCTSEDKLMGTNFSER